MPAETAEQYSELCSRVQSVAEDRHRTRINTGASRLVAGALGPFLLALMVDRVVPLPGAVRAAILIGCVIAAVYLLIREVVGPWRREFGMEESAEFIESRIPALRTSLITALQVHQDLGRDRPWFDRQMVAATVRLACASLKRFALRSVVDRTALRKWAACASVIVLAGVLYAALDFNGLASQLRRFFGAFTEIRDELAAGRRREILIAVLPDGKTTVLQGSSVTFEATMVGFETDHLDLRVVPEEGDSELFRLDTRGAPSVEHTLVSLERTFDALFSCGEIASERVRIRVVERPSVRNIQLEVIYPSYVRRPPLRLPRSSGEITALKGSHVVLTIEANKPLQRGHLEFEQGEPIALAVGGRFARGVLPVEEETRYRVRLVGEDGFTNESPRLRLIKVVHDQTPEVRFAGLGIEPEQEVQLTESIAGAKPLNVAAKDDYGVRKIIFHYDIEAVVKELYHEPIREQTRQRTFSIARQTWSGTIVRVGELGAKVGDRVSFWAEAQDGYDRGEGGQPQSSRTPVFHIVIIGEEFAWEDVTYQADASFDFGLYDSLTRKARGRRKPPREAIIREAMPEMPDIDLDLAYGHDEVPVQYQSAWKAYTSSLME